MVAGPPMAANDATDRRRYMVRRVMRGGPAGGAIPDIIIVVEIFSRIREVGAEGTVLGSMGNAGQAVRILLGRLRHDAVMGTAAAGSDWRVVPPINLGMLGQREAVAVYYNANVLQFTGPNLLWQLYGPPGAIVAQSQPVNAVTHAAITTYSPNWIGAMPPPAGRTTNFPIPGGGIVTIPENQLAGEWQYYMPGTVRPIPSPLPPNTPANRVQFPYVNCRAPFYTRFQELAGLGRTLHIFSVHTSPGSARQAINNMQNIVDISTPPLAGNVKVVLGDFNVDTFGGHWNAYNWMMPPGGHYTPQFDPRVAHAGPNIPARKPYLMTHLLPTAHATPYNTFGVAPPDPQHDVYPRFGYMGSSWPDINDSGAIDNIFTSYPAGGGAGAAVNPAVVNTLTGKPYNFLGAGVPAGVTAELTGGPVFASTLIGPNQLVNVPPAAAGTGGINGPNAFHLATFQGWPNFGKIYSTSDHLPLMIDI